MSRLGWGRLVLGCLVVAGCASTLPIKDVETKSRYRVRGAVVAGPNAAPVRGATLTLGRRTVETGEDGTFDLPRGGCQLWVEREGFVSQEFAVCEGNGWVTWVWCQLEPVTAAERPKLAKSRRVRLHGEVRDWQTGDPVPYANVKIVGTSIGVITDAAGSFEIVAYLADRECRLRALHVSYAEVQGTIPLDGDEVRGEIRPLARPYRGGYIALAE